MGGKWLNSNALCIYVVTGEPMNTAVKNYLKGIFYEPEGPSLTRALSVFSFLCFIAASFYLVITHGQWAHYETFATITGGGGIGGQVANKFMNNKKEGHNART